MLKQFLFVLLLSTYAILESSSKDDNLIKRNKFKSSNDTQQQSNSPYYSILPKGRTNNKKKKLPNNSTITMNEESDLNMQYFCDDCLNITCICLSSAAAASCCKYTCPLTVAHPELMSFLFPLTPPLVACFASIETGTYLLKNCTHDQEYWERRESVHGKLISEQLYDSLDNRDSTNRATGIFLKMLCPLLP